MDKRIKKPFILQFRKGFRKKGRAQFPFGYLNYEKQIYIIHENDEWVEPLIKELNNINAPFEEWHLGKRNIDHLDKPPQGVFTTE